ncbi:MAG: transposase [Thermoleophilia bacterium]
MLTKEDYMHIEDQLKHGVYQKDIVFDLGIHPKTIRRALKRGAAPGGRRPLAKTSKLDPFKPLVDELLADGVCNAKAILSVIREQGYTGGYTVLRDYIQPKRPLRTSRQTVRFETEPGVQLQNDWGELWTIVAGKRKKVHFSVNILGYSRRFHFWITDAEDAEHTYEGLIRSFEYFGGATARCWSIIRSRWSSPTTFAAGSAITRPSWICPVTTALCPGPADHAGLAPRARTSAWWAT